MFYSCDGGSKNGRISDQRKTGIKLSLTTTENEKQNLTYIYIVDSEIKLSIQTKTQLL